MDSTMQDTDAQVSDMLVHGQRVHPDAAVTEFRGAATSSRSFADLAARAGQLAGALQGLGVGRDDLVATLCWNTAAHLAAYFAVPLMGAVLHTLNLRLSDDQLAYIINHAGDRVVIVDVDLVPQLARILPRCPGVRDVIVVGPAAIPLGGATSSSVHDFDLLLDAADPVLAWPQLNERDAAVLFYTTGTTGEPKGVAYSHRSIYLHTLVISTGSAFAFSDADRVLPMVPMFHANAWGWPYAAWLNGADVILTGRYPNPSTSPGSSPSSARPRRPQFPRCGRRWTATAPSTERTSRACGSRWPAASRCRRLWRRASPPVTACSSPRGGG